MTHTLMICDAEEVYAEKLAEYINCSPRFLFKARHCNDIGKLSEYINKSDIDFLIINVAMAEEAKKILPPERIITMHGTNEERTDYSVYKYQSCENIMRKVLQRVSEVKGFSGLASRKTPMKMIGFYSPVKRSFQTTLALIMSQLYAKRGKTLYVNLEGYSYLPMIEHDYDRDMSDIMYDFENGKGDTAAIIASSVISYGEISILPPMRNYRDLRSIDDAGWYTFFDNIEKNTDYEFLILDISDNVQPLLKVIMMCSYIYMTTREDDASQEKCMKFKEDILKELDDYNEIQIVKCHVPVVSSPDIGFLKTPGNTLWSYAESIMAGNNGDE